MLIMSGNQRAVLWNGIPGIAVNLGLAIWLIPDLGVRGAAIANGGALVAISLIACIQVKVLLGMLPFSLEMWKPFAASLPALVGGHYAAQALREPGGLLGVLGVGLVVAVLYASTLALLGLSEGDRELLQRFRKRSS
jgi:O-antigen/teichoic acid export membrane protein